MPLKVKPLTSSWWGPPRKFDPEFRERRISWLELFFDLVYVIAISRITHHFAVHISLNSFLEYSGLFLLIFWGWLNGSLYHDIHGGNGLRTRLMTLWQVMIIAALSVTIDQPGAKRYEYMTIVLMIMQFYITYLWWSVGFYDREHRQYNRPYTILYLISLGLMGANLVLQEEWLHYIFPAVILCNYTPPFISRQLLRRSSLDLSLSSSMAERLGLLTIIVFGEVVLGVVNGISNAGIQGFSTWLNFGLALAIVFVLWWIFFTLLSNRNAKKGFNTATVLEILCILSLIALGVLAACLTFLFDPVHGGHLLQEVFGAALAVFLGSVSLMMGLLEYPEAIRPIRKRVRLSLFITAFIFLAFSISGLRTGTLSYLLIVTGILVVSVIYLNSLYYSLGIEETAANDETASS